MGSSMAACFFTEAPKPYSIMLSSKQFKHSRFGSCAPKQSLALTRVGSGNIDVVISASAIRPGGSVESDNLPTKQCLISPQISRFWKTQFALTRASTGNIDVVISASAIRPGGSVESDNLPTKQCLISPQISRFWKTQFALTRASTGSVDVVTSASAIRPGGSVESDKLPSDVRKRTMDAIDSCGRRVTIGDVASKAGLKLNEAQRALQALAADTNGFLEVSDEGDVLYVFPKDYRSRLSAKSLSIRFEPLLEKGKMAAAYIVRVSFGTALIASIAIVCKAIIAIISSNREGKDRGRRGRSYGAGSTIYFSPTDLFWYLDPYHYRRKGVRENDGGMNFIESVFSFVFGDGYPNQDIEEKRWKLIGQYIASNGGVVTAEELAPYLDLETNKNKDDDSYILPVLLRFDGQPYVDEEGNILYRFPSLQRTATLGRRGRKEYAGSVPKVLKENKLQFSKTCASERAMVIGLGAVNLFGVIILRSMLKGMAATPGGFISFVSRIFPLLQIYAGSFFAIPLIRWFLIQNRNAQIVRRNQTRELCANALESQPLHLRQKLLSARDMAQRTFIGQVASCTAPTVTYLNKTTTSKNGIKDSKRLNRLTEYNTEILYIVQFCYTSWWVRVFWVWV